MKIFDGRKFQDFKGTDKCVVLESELTNKDFDVTLSIQKLQNVFYGKQSKSILVKTCGLTKPLLTEKEIKNIFKKELRDVDYEFIIDSFLKSMYNLLTIRDRVYLSMIVKKVKSDVRNYVHDAIVLMNDITIKLKDLKSDNSILLNIKMDTNKNINLEMITNKIELNKEISNVNKNELFEILNNIIDNDEVNDKSEIKIKVLPNKTIDLEKIEKINNSFCKKYTIKINQLETYLYKVFNIIEEKFNSDYKVTIFDNINNLKIYNTEFTKDDLKLYKFNRICEIVGIINYICYFIEENSKERFEKFYLGLI